MSWQSANNSQRAKLLITVKGPPKYMFGFEVPKDYKHSLVLDNRYGNTRWFDATKVELNAINELNETNYSGMRLCVAPHKQNKFESPKFEN